MLSRITSLFSGTAPAVDANTNGGAGPTTTTTTTHPTARATTTTTTTTTTGFTAPTGLMTDETKSGINFGDPVAQPVVLITGSNRGLGLEFVRQLLEGGHEKQSGISNNCIVVAGCRNPDQAAELKKLKSMYDKRLDVVQLDVTNKSHIEALVKKIGETYGRLDLFISNAGILRHSQAQPDTADKVPLETIQEVLRVNTLAPIELTRALMPILKKTQQMLAEKNRPTGDEAKNPTYVRAIYITSIAGSLAMAIPGYVSYCMSKSALNRFVSSAAQVWPDIAFGLIHPGWVDTDMGRTDGSQPPVTVQDSISGMLKQLPKVTRNSSAKEVLAFDGSIVPF